MLFTERIRPNLLGKIRPTTLVLISQLKAWFLREKLDSLLKNSGFLP